MQYTLKNNTTNEDDSPTSFNQVLRAAVRATLQNIWEFAERKPQGVYFFVDFKNKAVDNFVMLDGQGYSPLDLHLVPGYSFDPLPQRRQAFLSYLQKDITHLGAIWAEKGMLRPNRLWSGVEGDFLHERLVLDYTPFESALPPVEAAVIEFRNQVLTKSWPAWKAYSKGLW